MLTYSLRARVDSGLCTLTNSVNGLGWYGAAPSIFLLVGSAARVSGPPYLRLLSLLTFSAVVGPLGGMCAG